MSELTIYMTATDLPTINARIAVLTAQIAAKTAELTPLQTEYANLLLVKSEMEAYVAANTPL